MSKRMFLLFSHSLTELQKKDAKESLGVGEFIELPLELQKVWSNIPPELANLNNYLEPIFNYLKEHMKENDYALVQGDFGATCKVAKLTKELNAKAIYATTNRKVVEKKDGNRVYKKSIFEHVRFREYE